MKRRKPAKVWSVEEKLEIIKKAAGEGQSVTEICKQFGISRKTFYTVRPWADRAPRAMPVGE